MPLFLFMAAGAMIAGGGYLLDEAKREGARSEALRSKLHEGEMLDASLKLEELRAVAQARGLDPDLVVRGATELANERLTVDEVMTFLSSGS
jgi:hypothetical protein